MKKNKFLLFAVMLLTAFLFSCRNLTEDNTYSDEYKKKEIEVVESDEFQTETLSMDLVDYYHLDNGTLKCEEKSFPLFFDSDDEIPFVEIRSFLNFWFTYDDDNPMFSIIKEGKKYKIAQKINEDSYVTVDFATGEVSYSDYDRFNASQTAAASCDIIATDVMLKRLKIMDIQPSKEFTVNLNDYDIPLKFEGGHGFMPLTVLQLLCGAVSYLVYNGKAVFADTDSSYKNTAYREKIKNLKEEWSEEFAQYSYNYLCLAMDMKYGRKAFLGISTFDSWLTDLKDDLCSTDVLKSESALGTMLLSNIGDLHTGYYHITPFLNQIKLLATNLSDTRFENNFKYLDEIAGKNSQYMYCDDDVKNFMNIFIPKDKGSTGIVPNTDTLFISFQNFESTTNYADYKANWEYSKIGAKGNSDEVYFYKSENGTEALTEDSTITTVDEFITAVNSGLHGYGISFENDNDTILITVVSNYIIQKLNSGTGRKIQNVVIDLSRNTGGLCDDEVFLSSWFLGQSDCHYKNTITGSSSSVSYFADVDFDEKYNNYNQYAAYERSNKTSDINDPEDTVCNLKRYCITSLQSFSCGNLFPSQVAFKDCVTLLGQKSGGGTCVVQNIGMPSGTFFHTSSPYQFSTLEVGNAVDIENGTGVDVGINPQDFDTVYNRETFCSTYIK